jgi:hypothetical protein
MTLPRLWLAKPTKAKQLILAPVLKKTIPAVKYLNNRLQEFGLQRFIRTYQ